MSKQETLKKILLNDSYISWLSNFMANRNNIDNLYYASNTTTKIDSNDVKMLRNLDLLYSELLSYYINVNKVNSKITTLCLKYNDNYYVFEKCYDLCSCQVFYYPPLNNIKGGHLDYITRFDYLIQFPYVEYEELKNQYDIAKQTNNPQKVLKRDNK